MKDIYYENSAGIRLNLLEPPYLLQTGEIFDTNWNYDYINLGSGGGRITTFRKDLEERSLTLSIINYGNEEFEAAVDRFHEVTEYDVLHGSPGRLYVGDMYMRCYFVISKKSEWEPDASYLDNDVTLVAEYPMWIREEENQYRKAISDKSSAEYLDYPFDYPLDFLGGVAGVGYINNAGDAACHFRMLVYGPCMNPRIIIADHVYEVATKLDVGEYMIIDSRDGSVKRMRNNGSAVDEFDNRNKKVSIFEKIPKGNSLVSWDGSFGFDIVKFYERGEPKWN